jgi:hypothetical protein
VIEKKPYEPVEKVRADIQRDPKVPASCPHCGAGLNDDCNFRLKRCMSSKCGRYTYSEILWQRDW